MGRKDIYKDAKGFDKNPQNINRKGQPPSLKKQLIKLLESDGKLKITWDKVISFKEGEEVIIKMPTEILLMQKLMSHAMSSGSTSLKAIEMMMGYIDGKPNQPIELEGEIKTNDLSGLTYEQLLKLRNRKSSE